MPRRGSRVRSPSRALKKQTSDTKWYRSFCFFESDPGLEGSMSTLRFGRRKTEVPRTSCAPSRAFFMPRFMPWHFFIPDLYSTDIHEFHMVSELKNRSVHNYTRSVLLLSENVQQLHAGLAEIKYIKEWVCEPGAEVCSGGCSRTVFWERRGCRGTMGSALKGAWSGECPERCLVRGDGCSLKRGVTAQL